ncbi:hypothetical protein DKT68_08380 [Micromonospora acroterricola]|uniref:Uncharacterized protein n=1 Tax=Micromonospora acroterricola TaxID=2202421 RepID=A0A317DD22_9ACTN|nr:hypothetical protein [Micromonospora acroterricola]PWR10623.1 hypothetical protein DKT68_08380 [Micromonospora acroterricola]
MSDDTSNRPSRREQRPGDVTDPLLWQLAVDVLSAHEPDENGACHNLLCADQPWPCAARSSAEQSLRLARGAAETPSTVAREQSEEAGAAHADRSPEGAPAARRAWSAGPVSARPQATASAA